MQYFTEEKAVHGFPYKLRDFLVEKLPKLTPAKETDIERLVRENRLAVGTRGYVNDYLSYGLNAIYDWDINEDGYADYILEVIGGKMFCQGLLFLVSDSKGTYRQIDLLGYFADFMSEGKFCVDDRMYLTQINNKLYTYLFLPFPKDDPYNTIEYRIFAYSIDATQPKIFREECSKSFFFKTSTESVKEIHECPDDVDLKACDSQYRILYDTYKDTLNAEIAATVSSNSSPLNEVVATQIGQLMESRGYRFNREVYLLVTKDGKQMLLFMGNVVDVNYVPVRERIFEVFEIDSTNYVKSRFVLKILRDREYLLQSFGQPDTRKGQ